MKYSWLLDRLFCLVFGIVVGLTAWVVTAALRDTPTAPPGLLPTRFRGEPAAKPIVYDLRGIWTVTRVFKKEAPSKFGRYDGQWNLVRDSIKPTKLGWADDHAQVWSNSGSDTGWLLLPRDHPQVLIWRKGSGEFLRLSINEQSFGWLVMTGDDEQFYTAVRTHGGEGDE